ncbi:MAG: Hpt domain-containing protein [Thermoanaerobaculia bacterium]|nr:Hpt domain-containing protein [Thermoanaerobaculia bacterium]
MTLELDPEVVAQIREVGGEELVRELFETFVENAGSRLEALRRARQRADLPGILAAAHSIRSAGASIGTAGLARLAGETERLARAGESGAVASAAALETALASTIGGLRLRLDGSSSPG